MTLPDNRPARKPRRLGLIIPWALAAAFVVAWSVGWFWLKGETERRMDATRASMAQSGWRLDWSCRKVSGFPFRLNVDLKDARWGDASGWSVTAPVLEAQAYISAPTHWTLVAPDGVVLTSGHGDSVTATGTALRASVSDFDRYPARISVEGIGLRFGGPTAQPAPLANIQEFHLHTRAGPSDQGAFYLELDSGVAGSAPSGPTSPTLIFDALYSHAGALRGRDWPRAGRAWRAGGGRITVRRLLVRMSDAVLVDAKSGDLTVNADGHLQGVLDGHGTPTTPIPFPGIY